MGCDKKKNNNRDCALFSTANVTELAFDGGPGTVRDVSTTAGAFRCICFTNTHWVRPNRKDPIQLCMFPLTSKGCRFRIKTLVRIPWSNALENSKTKISNWIMSSEEIKSWQLVTSWATSCTEAMLAVLEYYIVL